ncbi:MAG: phosphoribosylformylglycinamidine cyclo-ligase [Euryarchaeota archaeon]|nr:phosphoribosylformylglycinamidine cyclo-ligase [Euryarchaeota archaeon]
MIRYKDVAYDYSEEKRVIAEILRTIRETSTLSREKVLEKTIGHYASLIDIGRRFMAITTDGVGTKVVIAESVEKYETIGIDLVAMNANDLICVGAEPSVFVDYIALPRMEDKIIFEIMHGIKEGCKQANMAIVGGETAIMNILSHVELSGTAIGFVEKGKEILGDKINVGDIIIGIESSGIHSNGLSLVRKVLVEKYGLDYEIDGEPLWKHLLKPTRIYVKPIIDLIKHVKVHGIAHITGGAYRKILRITRYGYRLRMPEPPSIFKAIEREGVPCDEMYKTFNMGIGIIVVIPREEKEDALQILNKYYPAHVLGEVIKEHVTVIEKEGEKIALSP